MQSTSLAAVLAVLVAGIFSPLPAAEQTNVLPGTAALDWTDDLSIRIVDESHRLLDRKTEESIAGRAKFWNRDFSSPEAYAKSVEPNRQRLKKMLGAVDPRVPVRMERFGDDENPALVAETEKYRIFQVRWPVLDGVTGEGLLLEPKGEIKSFLIFLPDADQTPEQVLNLAPGLPPELQCHWGLTEGQCVLVPTLISRACDFSGNPAVRFTNQPHREWIYRQAFEMGRHVIGYEVQKVLAAVDWIEKIGGKKAKISMMGYAEGGLIAFYAAALDPRIESCMVLGYFDSRQRLWEEPIYRNVFGLLREFGDAEIATLIAPRLLVVSPDATPPIDGPPVPTKGRSAGAAPGRLRTPSVESVEAEADRVEALIGDKPGFSGPIVDQRRSPQHRTTLPLVTDARKSFNPQTRQQRQVQELVDHVQRLQRTSDRARDELFLNKAYLPPNEKLSEADRAQKFIDAAKRYREQFYRDSIGALDDPLAPANPRSRKIYDEPNWTGYEVVLDVLPDLHAWGILCLPKGIQPGERRPVVVCQHGLEGLPRDVVQKDVPGYRAYKAFCAELADRGYITFAPYNLYRGGDRFRLLQRKANPLGLSLFSIIIRQHEQILNWLGGLPEVDRSRIGFYGLSYGGKTAMRVPAVLEGYCLSICSGDFNDWVRKNVSVDFPASYMYTGEWEIFEWDLGHTFNYAEMSYLIFPRPFMVERGHHDGVGIDPWVASEYAKVRWLYANLGKPDQTEIEFFNGPHAIHGVGTYRFLDRHLRGGVPGAERRQ